MKNSHKILQPKKTIAATTRIPNSTSKRWQKIREWKHTKKYSFFTILYKYVHMYTNFPYNITSSFHLLLIYTQSVLYMIFSSSSFQKYKYNSLTPATFFISLLKVCISIKPININVFLCKTYTYVQHICIHIYFLTI